MEHKIDIGFIAQSISNGGVKSHVDEPEALFGSNLEKDKIKKIKKEGKIIMREERKVELVFEIHPSFCRTKQGNELFKIFPSSPHFFTSSKHSLSLEFECNDPR